MIELRKLNGSSFIVNSQLIQCIESIPDTLLCMTTGEKVRVLESPEEVVRKVTEFQRKIHQESILERSER